MTVSTLQNKIIYTTTGQPTYAFEFHTQVGSTIKVYLDDVLQTGGYNVLLNPDQVNSPGGAVQFDPTAPVAGLTLLIRREIPEQQNIDLEPYDPFPAEVAEDGFDKMTLITQQNSEGLSRAVKASGSDDGSTDFTLPAYVAGKGLMWDETTKSLTNSDDDLNGITDAAQASANAAAISEGNAATSEANAATSETNAANSEANALSYQNFARQWSSAPSDQTVNDGINPPGLSAYHWALVSQSSAAGLHYQGTWDPNSGAYPTNPGPADLWVANAEGTFDGKTWNPGDWLVRNTANTAWDQVPQTTAWDTIINVPANVSNALNRNGSDPMTGNLSITKLIPQILLRDTGGTRSDINVFDDIGVIRQSVNFDLDLERLNLYLRDTSGIISKSATLQSNGNFSVSAGTVPAIANDLTTKNYVDLAVAGASSYAKADTPSSLALPLTPVLYSNIINNDESIYNATNGRFTVPSGRSKIRMLVYADVAPIATPVTTLGTHTLYVSLAKNGVTLLHMYQDTGGREDTIYLESGVLNVIPGDYFTISFSNIGGGARSAGINSWASMEILT